MRIGRIGGIVVVASLSLACGGGSSGSSTGGGGGGGGGGTLALRGQFPATSVSTVRPSGFLAATDVSKVVAFSPQRYWTGPVVGGSFELQVDPGAPVGIVFAGAANQFLGSMALPSGLSAVPVQARSTGVSAIDLGTMLASGTVVTPGHDPVGAEIPLATADRTALRFLEGTFGSVIRRPDADGDGQVDVLQGRLYRPFLMYFADGGTFGGSGGTTAIPVVPVVVNPFRFGLAVSGIVDPPASATVTFPSVWPVLTRDFTLSRMSSAGDSVVYSTVPSYGPYLPPAGLYTVALGARTLTFDIPDQAEATAHVALAVPTVTLNADGTVSRVAWTYQLGDQGGTVRPEALIDDLILQIDGDGTANAPPCPANGGVGSNQGTRAYNSPNLGPSVVEHVLACQDIKWSAVRSLYMAYNDVYGNHMVVTWRR